MCHVTFDVWRCKWNCYINQCSPRVQNYTTIIIINENVRFSLLTKGNSQQTSKKNGWQKKRKTYYFFFFLPFYTFYTYLNVNENKIVAHLSIYQSIYRFLYQYRYQFTFRLEPRPVRDVKMIIYIMGLSVNVGRYMRVHDTSHGIKSNCHVK